MEAETTPVQGILDQAANLNTSVAGQASEQWFRTPEREPAFPESRPGEHPGFLLPLATGLLEDYSMGAAIRSPLRDRTATIVRDLIELQDQRTVTITKSEQRPAG
jgi:hypothetical protein